MTEHTTPVAVGDLTFDVRLSGPEDGPPVLLLHGFPETSLSWSSVAPLLAAAGLRVVAPDQRGYSPGARPTDVASYATGLLADDVLGLADALGIGSFHLVGHDWGAAVAWVVAANAAERVTSLTAVSVPHLAAWSAALRDDPDQRERGAYIQLMRQEGVAEEVLLADGAAAMRGVYGGAVSPDQVDAYVAQLSEPGALTAALGWYRAMDSSTTTLPAVQVPTTFVWSDGDDYIGRVPAEECGDHVAADYRFLELAGVSHWVPEEAPETLAQAVLDRVAG